ncbi:MAG: S1 RNA-binding domain-containing protein [Candidatus Kapaibacteriota bacterium]|jgi:small subunit ribosomal protein S1
MNENNPIASQTEVQTNIEAQKEIAEQTPNQNQTIVVQTSGEVNQPSAEEKPQSVEQTLSPESSVPQSTSSPEIPDKQTETEAERERRRGKRARLMQAFAEVKQAFQENKPIEVNVYARVRGGLRVFYKEAPLFLPASHFHLKRSPTDEELEEVVGKNLVVMVHEIQEYDEGSMAVIVSRKKLLEEEFWNNLKIGQIVEGKVSSVASFGVFIDLEGAEGLIHISRLAPYRIDNLKEYFKIGDTLKAVIVEIDKERKRIGLSRKELVDTSTWPATEEKYGVGTRHTGIVRRITDFGAFVELEPLVEGLLRTSEISWTKRLRRPNDVLKVGDKVEVVVTNFNAEKKAISLSMKRLQENPWQTLIEKYPLHSIYEGKVIQVVAQGCVVSISPEVDGFLPRSKMKRILKGNKIPFKQGDKIKVYIAEIVPEEESVILGLVEEEEETPKPSDNPKKHQNPKNYETKPLSSGISILDMISDEERENLLKSLKK